MLLKTDITEFTGTIFKNLGDHVINTENLNRPKAVNGSGSQFFYSDTSSDRRSKPMPVYCDASLTAIKGAMDAVLSSNAMTLNIFTNNDITQSTSEKFINYKQFVYAFGHRLNTSYSWVTFVERGSVTKVLVDNSLDQLVSAAQVGDESTIEWDDGVSYFRLQVRSGSIYLDQTKTATGFDGGSEPTDWDDIFSKSLP